MSENTLPRGARGHARKAGLPPGSMVYTGIPRDAPIKISIIDYDTDRLEEREGLTVEEVGPYIRRATTTTWVNVDGVHDAALIEAICRVVHVHPLTIEDILSIGTRAKFEEYQNYLYIVLDMLEMVEEKVPNARSKLKIRPEQVSILLGDGYVVTFLEDPGDIWDPVRKRLRAESGQIRKRGSDYLCYALLDSVVDSCFLALEAMGDRIEELEEITLADSEKTSPSEIHGLKHELLLLRKSVLPLREVTSAMLHCEESPLIRKTVHPYLRDLHDHVVQVIETAEIHRESTVALLELYLAGAGNRLNEIMKVLTILTAIFIPMTFIAGIYGMNFDNMPELTWKYGYYDALALMGFMAVAMLALFKWQKWI